MRETLVDRIIAHSIDRPDQRSLVFIGEDGRVSADLTFCEVDLRARQVAATLLDNTNAQDRALLVHRPGIQFVIDFLGCLYANVIPVPAYPRLGHRDIETIDRIANIVEPSIIATDIEDPVATGIAKLPRLSPRVFTNSQIRKPNLKDLALIQFTSGSTGDPKGVMISHENIIDNEDRIASTFDHGANEVIVSWLPHYHDMGLIGGVLQALYMGGTAVLMSPMDFLRRPVRWLQAIGDFGATTTVAPNFAYELCARRVSERSIPELDLSSLRVAVCGGEPVQVGTMAEFARRFSGAGLDPLALCPAYGLAEATLLVAGSGPSERVKSVTTAFGQTVVSCGSVGGDVMIVDSQGTQLAAGEIGEICVSSGSVSSGYWHEKDILEAVSDAEVEVVAKPYLRTGDLGFVLDGELYPTGRLKDLLIVRGRNYSPQDIEQTVENSISLVRRGCVAVFQVDTSIIVAVETSQSSVSPSALLPLVRQSVIRKHGVTIADVQVYEKGTIPKTSSGKIRRQECRERYVSDRDRMQIAGPLAPQITQQRSWSTTRVR